MGKPTLYANGRILIYPPLIEAEVFHTAINTSGGSQMCAAEQRIYPNAMSLIRSSPLLTAGKLIIMSVITASASRNPKL